MEKYDKFDCMANVPERYLMPFLWVDEGADIDSENIDKLKSMLFTPMTIAEVAKWTLIVIGLLLTVFGVAKAILSR